VPLTVAHESNEPPGRVHLVDFPVEKRLALDAALSLDGARKGDVLVRRHFRPARACEAKEAVGVVAPQDCQARLVVPVLGGDRHTWGRGQETEGEGWWVGGKGMSQLVCCENQLHKRQRSLLFQLIEFGSTRTVGVRALERWSQRSQKDGA
jgi:hypothetical protein